MIGGGNDGRRGLGKVFTGWCQHIDATATSASAPGGVDVFAQYRHPGPPVTLHRQFFMFTRSGPAGTTFLPPPAAPPVVDACPMMDCSDVGTGGTGGDTCTGQWGGSGPSNAPIPKVNKPIGAEWTVETFDPPGVGLGPAHPGFPGSVMVAFRFNLDFRVDLVFWTNQTSVPGAANAPSCRQYSSVQTDRWNVRFAVNFDLATGAVIGPLPAVRVNLIKDPNPLRRATPVDGMSLETRAPVALNVFSLDATA